MKGQAEEPSTVPKWDTHSLTSRYHFPAGKAGSRSAAESPQLINGNNGSTGTLGGTITIAQAIPEPGTWAMMLVGFGAVGFALRRKRKPALISQLA